MTPHLPSRDPTSPTPHPPHLQALEQLDRIIAASKTTPAASTPSRDLSVATGGAEATTAELHVLSSALDNLFKGSTRLDDAAISHFLTALSSQCLSALAHEATSREKAAVPGGAAPARLFALNKFVETAMANLERIATLWPLVTQLLLPVANHKAVRVRVLGAEALAKLVVAAMRHQLAAAPPASADAPRTPPPGPPAPTCCCSRRSRSCSGGARTARRRSASCRRRTRSCRRAARGSTARGRCCSRCSTAPPRAPRSRRCSPWPSGRSS